MQNTPWVIEMPSFQCQLDTLLSDYILSTRPGRTVLHRWLPHLGAIPYWYRKVGLRTSFVKILDVDVDSNLPILILDNIG